MAQPLFNADTVQHGNLAKLCPIVSGAIVSKPLIDTGSLKQILFAMDTGQDISEHRAPYVATVHVLTGHLRFTVAGETRDMGPSDWLVMPPNEPHDLAAIKPTLFLLVLVKG